MSKRFTLIALVAALLIAACRQSRSTPVPATSITLPVLPNGMTPVATSEAAAIRPHMPDEFSTPVPWNPDFTPQPGPTRNPSSIIPTPTPTSPYPAINLNVELPYFQDGGVLPSGALARIGLGNVYEVNLLEDNTKMMLETAAGIYMIDTASFERIWRRYLERDPWDVSISPDGARLAAEYGWDGSPMMYETATGNPVTNLPGWHGAHWSPHSTLVAVEEQPPFSADMERFTARLRLYNGTSGQEERVLEVPIDGFWGAVFSIVLWSPDGETIAACGDAGIYLWNVSTGALRHSISANSQTGGLYMRSCDMSFSPDGASLLVQDAERTFVINVVSGEVVNQIVGGASDITWHADRLYLINADKLRVIDTASWQEVYSAPLGGHGLSLSPDESKIGIVSDQGTTVLDTSTFQPLFKTDLPAQYVYWSPGGRWLMHTSSDFFTIFDGSTGDRVAAPMQPYGGALFIDDETLLVYDASQLILVDLNDLSVTGGRRIGLNPQSISWSADGKTLCIMDGQERSWQWSEQTGIVEQTPCASSRESSLIVPDLDWRAESVQSPSPDGSITARVVNNSACGDGPFGGGCGIWGGSLTILKGDEVLYQEGADEEDYFGGFGASALTWSMDGHLLAIAKTYAEYSLETQAILILDPLTGETIMELKGHLAPAQALLFSPDGTRLASVSADGTIIIWSTTH
jgi:WD40 repeat protein